MTETNSLARYMIYFEAKVCSFGKGFPAEQKQFTEKKKKKSPSESMYACFLTPTSFKTFPTPPPDRSWTLEHLVSLHDE